LILIGFLAFRLGFIDRYVAGQIKNTLATYGVRAEIKPSTLHFRHRRLRCWASNSNDAKTARSWEDRSDVATVRIEDLYALNLRRISI